MAIESIFKRTTSLANFRDAFTLQKLLSSFFTDTTFLRDRMKSQLLLRAGVSPILRIKGGSASAIVNATNAMAAVANGVLVIKAANTDQAALVGSVTNAKFNVFSFFIDSAGVLTSAMGVEGNTLALVTHPTPPAGKAQIGYVIINPTGTGPFVGGTTVLDDATVVPNAVFMDTPGPIDTSTVLQVIA